MMYCNHHLCPDIQEPHTPLLGMLTRTKHGLLYDELEFCSNLVLRAACQAISSSGMSTWERKASRDSMPTGVSNDEPQEELEDEWKTSYKLLCRKSSSTNSQNKKLKSKDGRCYKNEAEDKFKMETDENSENSF